MPSAHRKLARVALVGRRNVGKSTLLNTLYGRRRAITDAFPGLTRDILEVEIQRNDYHFILSDTPGLDIENPNALEQVILERALSYLQNVDVILILFEAPAMAPFDQDFLNLIRRKFPDRPVVYAVNKVDGPEHRDEALLEFYEAGIIRPIPISAKSRWNLPQLLERLAEAVPRIRRAAPTTTTMPAATENGRHATVPEPMGESPDQIRDESAAAQEYLAELDESDYLKTMRNARRHGNKRKPTGTRAEIVQADSHALESGYVEIEDAVDSMSRSVDADFDADDESSEHSVQTHASTDSAGNQTTLTEWKNDSTVVSSSVAGEVTRIAIVGRPNAGKSSLFNRFVGRDVSLVSDIAGTTRDTVDTLIRFHGKVIRVVDTAGMRRAGRIRRDAAGQVEFYSIARTRRAIRDARVVIHVIDAQAGVTDFDKKIQSTIVEYRRPVVIAINKWDIQPEKHTHSAREFQDRLEFLFPHAANVPIVFCSALTGQRLPRLLETALDLDHRMRFRVATSELNERVREWMGRVPGTARKLKIFYASQIDTEPPAFAFIVNNKKEFRANIISYFENRIRQTYQLQGVPIHLFARERSGARD
ncbi:MAG: 50S ribosome-binding GTPase [Leptospiraceae bacterium]|nr:50S ribosome-binding GTPase [Leptospiraceae bacterium]